MNKKLSIEVKKLKKILQDLTDIEKTGVCKTNTFYYLKNKKEKK